MADSSDFHIRFRWILLLAFFSGTYIPDMDKILPKNFPILTGFSAGLVPLVYNLVDFSLKMLLDSDDFSFITYFTIGNEVFCYILLWSGVIYMICCHTAMQDLISTWSNDFRPELWPELRDETLKTQERILWKQTSNLITFVLIPLAIFGIYVVYNGELMVGSILVPGEPGKAPRFVVFLQFCSDFGWFLWFTMSQIFFLMILRLILAELDYMDVVLQKLFSKILVHRDGCMHCPDYLTKLGNKLKDSEYRKMCSFTEETLFKVISYHCKIFRFTKKVDKFFAPIFFMQVIMCSMICSTTEFVIFTKAVPTEYAITVAAAVVYWFYLCHMLSAVGGNIREKGLRLLDSAFHSNWMAYPIHIQKLLIPMIAMGQKRQITVNPFGILPMIPETYFSLVTFQYKVFRFFRDTLNY